MMTRHPARSSVLVASLSALIAVSSLPGVAAAAPLLGGLGGPAGYGVGNLPANDDGSSAELDVRAAFPSGLAFFGTTYTSLWVNNNGNVSFGGRLNSFTPRPFPIASQPMIAPWWGDVDTRGGGAPARNGVYWSVTPGRFVATWHDVGFYASNDSLQNDFQMILTVAPPGVGDFDVEFRYNRCEWTTGDASGGMGGFGGTPAQAGFDAGNLMDFVALPGSLTMRVLDLCTTSNVGIPGIWRFEIRGGEVMCPGRGDPCSTGMPGECDAGTMVCLSADEAACMPDREPEEDLCNGLDDDCDGATDEALGSTTCGIGECVQTTANCVMGTPQTCVPRPPQMEACNLLDDDCDGVIDELPPLTCGVGACMNRVLPCVDGVPGRCVPGEPTPELCNGVDDDCNGLIDDTLPGCEPPDAGPPPVDSGMPFEDASTPPPDAGFADAGARECVGENCYPLSGRAGPIGRCNCRAAGSGGSPWPATAVFCALLGLLTLRRRGV